MLIYVRINKKPVLLFIFSFWRRVKPLGKKWIALDTVKIGVQITNEQMIDSQSEINTRSTVYPFRFDSWVKSVHIVRNMCCGIRDCKLH